MNRKLGVLLLMLGLVFPVASGWAAEGDAANVVRFDYTLTVDNEEVESTAGKTPLEYTPGLGQLIPGLEEEMAGMKAGDAKTIVVKPEDGYGLIREDALREFPLDQFPEGMAPQVGMIFEMEDDAGNAYPATVKEIRDNVVLLDFNHPLAGKELTFDVKIVSVE